MQVMLLAAGKSTRLGALGAERPKPLVPVCGYPPLAFGLALCRAAGLRDIVVNLHHHAEKLREVLGDGSAYGVEIRTSLEAPDILGTGGGLVKARALFRSEPVLVMNGKVVADLDLAATIAHHRAQPLGTVATMVVRKTDTPERFAPVEVDARGRVVGLRGERGSVAPEGDVRPFMFTGVHVIESSLLDRLPRAGFSDVVGEGYLPALRAGERVAAFETTGYFEEHSTPESYLAGNLALLRRPALVPHPPGPLVGVDSGAHVHASATIVGPVRVAAGAVIEAAAIVGPDVVVGEGAVVTSGTRVRSSVVWPGARVAGVVERAVVTANAVVAVA